MSSEKREFNARTINTNSSRSFHHLVVVVTLGGVVSLAMYAHGVAFWYAPVVIVATHILMFAGIALTLSKIAQKLPFETDQGSLIRRPRLYDIIVRTVMLGRESAFRRRTLDLAELQLGDDILDVGCGTGTLVIAAADRVGPTGSLVGVDPSIEMVECASEKAGSAGVAAKFIPGVADELEFASASFDAVFCIMALHHIPEDRRKTSIDEMARVLRPGGRLILVDFQQPKGTVRAILSALTLISLIHGRTTDSTHMNALGVETQLASLGFNDLTRHAFGVGAIGAMVGRLHSGHDSNLSDQRERD